MCCVLGVVDVRVLACRCVFFWLFKYALCAYNSLILFVDCVCGCVLFSMSFFVCQWAAHLVYLLRFGCGGRFLCIRDGVCVGGPSCASNLVCVWVGTSCDSKMGCGWGALSSARKNCGVWYRPYVPHTCFVVFWGTLLCHKNTLLVVCDILCLGR